MKVFKAIFNLLKINPLLSVTNCIVAIPVNMAFLLPGLIIKELFDTLEGKHNANMTIPSFVALMLAAYFGRIIAVYCGAWLDITQRFLSSTLLRRNLLEGIFKKPAAFPKKKAIGDILSSFRDDIAQIEESVALTVDMIGTLLYTIVALIILFSISVKMTILVFLPMVIVLVISKKANGSVARYRKQSRNATATVTGAVGEVFSAVQAIQIANAEESVMKNLRDLNGQRRTLMLKDGILSQVLNSIYQNLSSFATGLILLLGASLIKDGSFSIGDFSLFVNYLSFVTLLTQYWGNVIANYQQTNVSFERLQEILDTQRIDELVGNRELKIGADIPNMERARSNSKEELSTLEIKGLTYIYPQTGGGINDVNFEMKKNEIIVITGRVGSGKTTLLRALLGLLPTQAGEIYWNERLVRDQSDFFVPPICSYTPQLPNLISDTVRNNILLGLDEKKHNLDKAIEMAILDRDLQSLDSGLDTFIGTSGKKLSGGQQQRVAAARMFIRDPELLVFDDISSALDVETESLLWAKIAEKNNHTCIAISNKRIALTKANKILVIKDGEIESQGSLEYVMEHSAEFKLIWGD